MACLVLAHIVSSGNQATLILSPTYTVAVSDKDKDGDEDNVSDNERQIKACRLVREKGI